MLYRDLFHFLFPMEKNKLGTESTDGSGRGKCLIERKFVDVEVLGVRFLHLCSMPAPALAPNIGQSPNGWNVASCRKRPLPIAASSTTFRTPPLSFCKGKLIRLLPDLSLYHQSPLYKNIQSFPWAGLIHGERLPLGRVAGRKRQAPILQGKKCYVLVQARPIGARN